MRICIRFLQQKKTLNNSGKVKTGNFSNFDLYFFGTFSVEANIIMQRHEVL